MVTRLTVGDNFVTYTNVESLYTTFETNIISYINYISLKKKTKHNIVNQLYSNRKQKQKLFMEANILYIYLTHYILHSKSTNICLLSQGPLKTINNRPLQISLDSSGFYFKVLSIIKWK